MSLYTKFPFFSQTFPSFFFLPESTDSCSYPAFSSRPRYHSILRTNKGRDKSIPETKIMSTARLMNCSRWWWKRGKNLNSHLFFFFPWLVLFSLSFQFFFFPIYSLPHSLFLFPSLSLFFPHKSHSFSLPIPITDLPCPSFPSKLYVRFLPSFSRPKFIFPLFPVRI